MVSFPYLIPALEANSDVPGSFCTVQNFIESDSSLEDIRYSRARELMLLFPTISFAFSFECSVLPVHQASRKADPTGGRSYQACVRCLVIVMTYYSLLMIHSVVYGEWVLGPKLRDPQTSVAYKACDYLYALPIIDMVRLVSTGKDQNLATNVLSMILILLFTIQSFLQLLYTFYECRTHIQIMVQEILYRDTSSYVEAVKLRETKELDRHTFNLLK